MGNFSIASLAASTSNLSQARGDLAIKGLRESSNKENPAKIDKAARDFESLLVGQWLEKAEKSFATVPGSDPDQDKDAGHDQFQSIACEYLARGLSQSGGFGIAKMISKHLVSVEAKHTGGDEKTPPVTSVPVTSGADEVSLSAAKLKDDK
jgi:Rod binding domain-containing protein